MGVNLLKQTAILTCVKPVHSVQTTLLNIYLFFVANEGFTPLHVRIYCIKDFCTENIYPRIYSDNS